MMTALLVLAALVVLVGIVGILYVMATDGFFAVWYTISGVPGSMFKLLGSIIAAIIETNQE